MNSSREKNVYQCECEAQVTVLNCCTCLFVVDLDRPVRRLRVLDVRFDAGAVDVVFVYWYW